MRQNPQKLMDQLVWYTQSQASRNPISNKVEGKHCHLRQSHLHMHSVTCAHSHSHTWTHIHGMRINISEQWRTNSRMSLGTESCPLMTMIRNSQSHVQYNPWYRSTHGDCLKKRSHPHHSTLQEKDVLISRARQKATVASLGQVPFPALWPSTMQYLSPSTTVQILFRFPWRPDVT